MRNVPKWIAIAWLSTRVPDVVDDTGQSTSCGLVQMCRTHAHICACAHASNPEVACGRFRDTLRKTYKYVNRATSKARSPIITPNNRKIRTIQLFTIMYFVSRISRNAPRPPPGLPSRGKVHAVVCGMLPRRKCNFGSSTAPRRRFRSRMFHIYFRRAPQITTLF